MRKHLFTLALALMTSMSFSTLASASPVGKPASKALLTLATTGNPKPLKKELGGTIASSDSLAAKVKPLLKETEHLAPKALTLSNGDIYVMVAPIITKDNFIYIHKGKISRLDVGATEGTKMPFVVNNIVEDGGASVWEQLGHWWDNL